MILTADERQCEAEAEARREVVEGRGSGTGTKIQNRFLAPDRYSFVNDLSPFLMYRLLTGFYNYARRKEEVRYYPLHLNVVSSKLK